MRSSALLQLLAAIAAPLAASAGHMGRIRGGAWSYHEMNNVLCDGDHTGCEIVRTRSLLAQDGSSSSEFALEVSATTIEHMDTVNVTYTVANASTYDWIGVYCADDESAPPADDDYMDSRLISTSNTTTLTFGPLVNMRCSWQFRYFARPKQYGTSTHLADSEFVAMANGVTEPLHVHISLTGNDTQMRVMWVSGAVASPTVSYGASADALSSSLTASSRTYNASDMCSAPATKVANMYFRDPGQIYEAVLTDLEPETTYYYQVGEPSGQQSAVFSFTMPPAPGVQSGTMSFFMFGDLGEWMQKATDEWPEDAPRQESTIELIRKDMNDTEANYVAVMHDGDISYGMGRTYLWDQFGALVQPVAAEIAYMVGVGNHEYDYISPTGTTTKDPSGVNKAFTIEGGNYAIDSQGECGVPTDKRFVMPDNGNKVFWWSVEYGLTHHVMLSSEHDYTTNSSMYNWLIEDLESVDRSKTPWLFLHIHRPLYCSVIAAGDNNVSVLLREYLEPVLADYNVDVVFAGHYHSYEITCAVYNQTCRTEDLGDGNTKALAPVHIMVGSAGADVDTGNYSEVAWSEYAVMDYGYGRVHVYNATHTQFEFVLNRDKAVTSSKWIISDHNWTISTGSAATPSSASGAETLGVNMPLLLAAQAVLLSLVLFARD